MTNTNFNLGKLIRRIIVLVMALLTFFMLFFALIKMSRYSYYNYSFNYYIENGFTFLTFQSEIISSSFNWALILIGLFSAIFLIMSVVTIIMATINLVSNKIKFDMPIIAISLGTTFLYMFIGLLILIVCKATYSSTTNFHSSAFWPFIFETLLLIGYIVIANVFKAEKIDNVQATPSTLVKSSQSYQSAPKTIPADTQPAKPAVQPKKELSVDNLELLKQLADLKEKNIISEEEFNAKKKELLGL